MENKGRPKNFMKTLGRIIKDLFSFYPTLLPITLLFIVINAVVTSIPAIFQQKIISLIETVYKEGNWDAVSSDILRLVGILLVFYTISLICAYCYNMNMATITQGSLKKYRQKMFNHMQDLPIAFFDRNKTGDIMSHYTNDIDAMRQFISICIPQAISSLITVITVVSIMLYYSLWLSLLVVLGSFIMLRIVKVIGGKSSHYFVRQQEELARSEGFIQEMMNGQKVIKVFNHEEKSIQDFDRYNDELFRVSNEANRYSNVIMPILNNIGNILYVLVAIVGGALLAFHVPNISISGLGLSIAIVIPFLNMTKQFAGVVGQISSEVNAVVMGVAGANRVYQMIDEEVEEDEGKVVLVNCSHEGERLVESKKRTELWAWKSILPDGSISLKELKGDMELKGVDFSYDGKRQILKNIDVFARPGEKVAFVGATGAGKTTITNLLNRFYDIQRGEIIYDGINIRDIAISDLRRSIAVILQDTVLFTGTVMENIRYGKLDATDEECIAAAKLAGADDFITRLTKGYDTELSANGGNLSQGQRQLLSIARAAVNDPPVLIMDEATSSIDTRTEAIVQKGMDALMAGRTVFVIAHRLSTVQNSDVIMVLEQGEIIERGSHKDLIAAKGKYYQLYTGAFELE
ncbi:ABC transporter ATP-binding protein [Oribacterium sinus]|uniref:ABC transporter, ATP-binding protein n=1 Tax=Oribacterium sinus F0268 TaxID=585501 RepID=C2KW62_9FIRM|nr:ABC transporter ATP-binding protein [Oribacterium sinus]EEJ51998.1 ABC transporter, ATP-binding protein [Oribacterium sinus F0268]